MTILLIIISLLVGIVIWLLLAPIMLVIDSNRGIYEIRIKSIGHLDVRLEQEWLILDGQVFFLKRKIKIDLMNLMKGKSDKKAKRDGKSVKEKKRPKFLARDWNAQRIKQVLHTFRIQIFRLNLDTGNYYYNGLMYPMLSLLSRKNMNLSINFMGKNEFELVVKNRLSRILYAALLTKNQ